MSLFYSILVRRTIRAQRLNAAKMKLTATLTFETVTENDSRHFFRDLFRRAGQRVVVMFRIYKAMKQVVTENNYFIFNENEESKLYRKFLTRWSTYWEEKQRSDRWRNKLNNFNTFTTVEKRLEGHKLYMGKTQSYKFVSCNEKQEGNNLVTSLSKMEEIRKSNPLISWKEKQEADEIVTSVKKFEDLRKSQTLEKWASLYN